MKLAKKLVLARQIKGWNQSDLARAADVPQPTISRLEVGISSNPRMMTLAKIARALEVSADYLLFDRK